MTAYWTCAHPGEGARAVKYRKKPVVIEAEQFRPDKPLPFNRRYAPCCLHTAGYWYIDTLEGQMRICEGDWIIRGVNGEFYPCKPDIFEATYEEVEEPAP